ncbi:Para-Rep C10 [Labeo rohita]|uniref:Para-Rep C10 n=1 Tax=Labeo rohita TaxID=84645 RepID=A0ABQ8MDR0_LABRO|nr:Para-Rep C10 [Labeo rohita]
MERYKRRWNLRINGLLEKFDEDPRREVGGLIDRGLKFVKDLTREDRNAQAALWPQIEQARKEGKKAFFRGPHGFIEGRRINVT